MANPLLLARQLGNLMAKGTLPAMAKVVPAAAVIPAPIACIEVVAVESPFSSFPHGTCLPSASTKYLAVDEFTTCFTLQFQGA